MTLESKLVNYITLAKLDTWLLTDAKKLDQKKISRFSQWLLAVYLIWIFSQLTWLLFPNKALNETIADPAAMTNLYTQQSNGQFDLASIKALNLFGAYQKPSAQPVKQKQEAPITRLNLKLMGVVSSNDPSLSAAIIEKSGNQETYGIDEKVTDTSAVIKEIYADRIILEQRGKRETLMLEGADYTKMVESHGAVGTTDMQSNKRTLPNKKLAKRRIEQRKVAQIEQYRKEISQDPGKINDYIKASPVKEEGRLIGYRIRPGKSVELFNAFGLRSGDIAIEINGYDLTDLSQAMTAMQELRSASEANLIVNRGGEIVETLFSLH